MAATAARPDARTSAARRAATAWPAFAHADTDGDTDSHAGADAIAHADTFANTNTDAVADTKPDAYAHAVTNADS